MSRLFILGAIGSLAAVLSVSGCTVQASGTNVGCTTADNVCVTDFELDYCDVTSGAMITADCDVSCTSDPDVYLSTCGGGPAIAGECDDAGGQCLCFCQDSFDRCLDDFTVEYTRDGVTYQVDCNAYCGGTCDPTAGACAC